MNNYRFGILLVVYTHLIFSQTYTSALVIAADGESLRLGVVVEKVEKNSEAYKAGLKEGDIIESWSRGNASGQINSPFDLSWVETEQRPRGDVTLAGLRGEESHVWTLGADTMGLLVRPNFSGVFLAMYGRDQELIKAGKVHEAAQRWCKAASEAENTSIVWLRTWMFFRAATLSAAAQQWNDADDEFSRAVHQADAPVIAEEILRAWYRTRSQRGSWEEAEIHSREALEQSMLLGPETLTQALDLENLGHILYSRNDSSAEKFFEKSLAMTEKIIPHSLRLCDRLYNVGSAMVRDPVKAEQYLVPSLVLAEELVPETLRVALRLYSLGSLAAQRGNLVKGEQYLRRAVAIVEKVAPGSANFAQMLTELANVFYERGDLDKAEEYYRKALDIANKTAPDSLAAAAPVNNLGNIELDRGHLDKAEDYYQKALAIHEKVSPDGLRVANSFNSLGDVARSRGDLAGAENYYLRALTIREKIGPGGLAVAESLHSLEDIALDQRNPAKAEEYGQKVLSVTERLAPGSTLHAESLASLAGVRREKGQLVEAVQLFEKALDAFEGQISQLGGSESIRSDFRSRHQRYYKEYIDLLMTQRQSNQAFQVSERSRARTLLEMLAVAHVDISEGVDPDLLDQEQGLRDRLRSKINSRIQLLGNPQTEKQVQAIDNEIAGLLRQNEEFEERIRVNSPAYAALTQPRPLNADAVQRLLPDDTLLLEYSLGASHSYVFAITTNSLKSYELPPSMELEGKAARLYQLLTERSRIIPTENDKQRRARLRKADEEFGSASAGLSRMLLGPVTAELQQRRLLIVSDGALQYVPFAALPSPELALRKSKSSWPLIVQHEIVNLPSASVLAFLRKNTTINKEVAVFADPVFDNRDSRVKSDAPRLAAFTNVRKQDVSQDSKSLSEPSPQLARNLVRAIADMNPGKKEEFHLPRLAFTRDEAKSILAVVPPGQGMEALDFDASRRRAINGELTRYRVVHFATHALVDNIHPELSGLVLSLVDQRGEAVEGFLGLQDIYNMKLSADLVVLSACQTALGKQINGEGMIGLTRGFMYAGASGVVATLWNVNDFATAKLMARFYKAMERDRMTPARALRQAQLSLWKEQASSASYFWAGFILQGGWQ